MTDNKTPIKVGISLGDLNGIGGEIILKSFDDQRMMDLCTPVLFGGKRVVSFLIKHFDLDLRFHQVSSAEEAVPGKFNLVNIWDEPVKVDFGTADKKIGEYAFLSLRAAVKSLKEKSVDTLTTAPINKHVIQSEDFQFPGHTDYLAKELKGNSLMFMTSKAVKVGLMTDHVALKNVSSKINKELIQEKVQLMWESLKKDFTVQKPRIAVLGVNPHSGDNGVIGTEDDAIVRPAVQEIHDEGKLIYGPYAADSFFGTENHKNFDAVLAAYHDQGLIPFKTLSFGQGVNFTAGLSRVRTSPDHGTAYGIAGKGEADTSSFKEAIFKGMEIFSNRKQYEELTKNPLKSHSKRRDKHA